MDVKKTFCIILLFLILFSAITLVSASDDKSYSIDQAFVELTVGSNGLLHVDEIYDFFGNDIEREIPFIRIIRTKEELDKFISLLKEWA